MMNGLEVKTLTLGLLKNETERDRQRKVGASQISDPCDKHLAKALQSEQQPPSKYWLGGKFGTAMHLLLEDAAANASLEQFPELEDCRIEEKIRLGELEGYGTISSKPDLALVKRNHLIDWKTSTRAKSTKLMKYVDGQSKDAGSEYTIKKYVAQSQLYAWGLNQAGVDIDGISLVFISRDGTNEGDIWEHTFEYRESLAIDIWQRLEFIWAQLQQGEHPDNFNKTKGCFLCETQK